MSLSRISSIWTAMLSEVWLVAGTCLCPCRSCSSSNPCSMAAWGVDAETMLAEAEPAGATVMCCC
jgi:hypothetical protein